MKIVVVTMVKNEEAYIESSIRYWLTFADQIILYDHNSSDATMPILRDLMTEFGERLVLFNECFSIGVEKEQAVVTNAMAAAAFRQYGADLVIPLDADEFPYLTEGGSLREFLSNLPQNDCYLVYWMSFTPSADHPLAPSEFVPMAFSRKKRSPMDRWGKAIVTREYYEQHAPVLRPGNHGFVVKEKAKRPSYVVLTPRLCYAHYPCRGKEHYVLKNLQGWLAVYSSIDWIPGNSRHYQQACEQIKTGEVTDQIVDWYCLSSSGMTGETVEDIQNAIETIDPSSIFPDIPIRYTPRHIVNQKEIVLLFETAIRLAEQYREKGKKEIALRAENGELDAALAKVGEEKKALDSALAKAAEEKKALDGALAKAAEEKKVLDSTLAKTEEEKKALDGALAKAAEEKKALSAALAKAAEERKTLDRAFAKTVEEKKVLEGALAKGMEEKKALRGDLSWAKEEIQTLKTELDLITDSKAFKLGTLLATPLRLARRFFARR